MPNQLGEKIKQIRIQKGFSLVEVGKAINMSHNFLSEIERGKKLPSNETIRTLANFFQCDEDELFRLSSKPPLRSIEYLVDDVYLQKLLSEVLRKYGDNPKKLEVMRKKVTDLYRDFLDSED